VDVWSYRTAAALARATGIPFKAHDLRRTVATMMGELGIDSDTIGLVLNHRKPGVTTRHYDHSTRETAKRAALDRWAQRLVQIVTETPAKVTPIRARA
jgi:integrase